MWAAAGDSSLSLAGAKVNFALSQPAIVTYCLVSTRRRAQPFPSYYVRGRIRTTHTAHTYVRSTVRTAKSVSPYSFCFAHTTPPTDPLTPTPSATPSHPHTSLTPSLTHAHLSSTTHAYYVLYIQDARRLSQARIRLLRLSPSRLPLPALTLITIEPLAHTVPVETCITKQSTPSALNSKTLSALRQHTSVAQTTSAATLRSTRL